ncbi:hypothetical protein Tco_0560475 [Tanacetum coccineum]
MYEKVKRFDESFTAVGSTEDERMIKEMNEGVKDTDHKRLKEEDIEKSDDDSDDEHRKCLKTVTFEGTLDSEIMEKKSGINIDGWSFDFGAEWDCIHMLVERRYPLSKELLQRMLDLRLEVERESIVALDLIRFIKKQIDEE